MLDIWRISMGWLFYSRLIVKEQSYSRLIVKSTSKRQNPGQVVLIAGQGSKKYVELNTEKENHGCLFKPAYFTHAAVLYYKINLRKFWT